MEATLPIDDERTAFLEAFEESLRPLMRVVFAYGVSYQDLIEVVRGLYVYALRDQLEGRGRATTPSRLGMMSGVTRGEIISLFANRELRAQQRALATKRMDQLSLLLGKWHDDPRFSTPYGAPLDLSLAPDGNFRTFDELIADSGTELDRETAIAALLENRCAEVHAAKFIRCTTRSFFPIGKDLSRISRLGRLGGAMHSTYAHNLLRDPTEPSFFERTMVSDFRLSQQGRNSMLGQLKQDGEEFVDGLDRWVSSKEADFQVADGRRYGVTAFFFEDIEKTNDSKSISLSHRAEEPQQTGPI